MADAHQLPPSVEQLIAKICTDQNQPPLGLPARRVLASLEEEVVLEILCTIASSEIRKSFDGFVFYLVKQKVGNSSPVKRLCLSPTSPQQSSRSSAPAWLMMHQQCTLTIFFSFVCLFTCEPEHLGIYSFIYFLTR